MRTVPVAERSLSRAGEDRVGRPIETGSARMIALTWEGVPDAVAGTTLRLRTRRAGAWSEWSESHPLADGPDPTETSNGRSGTDPIWVESVDAVQVGVRGPRPRDLSVVLIDPGTLPADAATSGSMSLSSATVEGQVPKPDLRTRRDWGANRAWRKDDPQYNWTIKQVHLHHTVNSNDYSRVDVPAMIRGMHRYHTQSLGWNDIGYNFLVDRFGRTWIGRAGGASRPVRGAHTLGFNHTSVGVAVIGNHETREPDRRVLRAVVHLAAWKLDKYDRDPRGWITVRSQGSDKYPEGEVARLPVIDGHRDTNDTACPGRYLYDRLPGIRRRTSNRIERY